MNNKEQHQWGKYYYQGLRKNRNWALEVLHNLKSEIPTFQEIFDQETFYMFAFLVVVGTILFVIFLAKVVGVKIKEHPLEVNRDWGEPVPAHFFTFPWQEAKNRKEQEETRKAKKTKAE
ncbi:unnamed protein product, partial [Mesorhabditis spiculigera]